MIRKKHKHIYRTENDGYSDGYVVRIRHNGEDINKSFFESTNGGKKEALQAAITWRNAKWKTLGFFTHRADLPQVNRITCKDINNNITLAWRCRWKEKDGGKRFSKCFSEGKYGVSEAEDMAYEVLIDVFEKYYNFYEEP